MKSTAIYPGTFDPVTNGHVDMITRAAKIFSEVVVAVAINTAKRPFFSLEQRIDFVKDAVKDLPSVRVVGFDTLLINFAKLQGASIILRGLRAVSDFEYEFQMFGMNAKLDPSIQTIFLPASESTHFIASRLVKEVARLGGNVSNFVSKNVEQELHKIFKR